MREKTSPFTQFMETKLGLLFGALGALLWIGGCLTSTAVGVILGFPLESLADFIPFYLGILAVCSVLMPAMGSVMIFFGQSMSEAKPLGVPAHLLPRWWLMRFMYRMSLLWSAIFAITTLIHFFGLRISGLLSLAAFIAAIFAYRYFKDQLEQLSPPYPPMQEPKP